MNKICFTLFFLVSINSFSQDVFKEIKPATYITSRMAFFYKNSWNPFTGNIMMNIKYKNQNYSSKIKFKNGMGILTELYNSEKNDLTLQITQKNIKGFDSEIYDSIHLKTSFNKNEIFTDTLLLKKQYVTNYYYRLNNKNEKLNGFVKSNKKITYFIDGMKSKIEYFYDDELKIIKESYTIFRTEIGNIDNCNKNDTTLDGPYTIWDFEGKIIESGILKMVNKKL